ARRASISRHSGWRRSRFGHGVEDGGEVLLQVGSIRRSEELTSSALRHAGKALHCLLRPRVETDNVHVQARCGLLQRFRRGADIRLATVRSVGDQYHIETSGRRLLGGLDQRRSDRFGSLGLEACAEQKLARSLLTELSRLC